MGDPALHLGDPRRPASAAFFAETLGWRPIERPGNVPSAAAWLEVGGGQELHLLEVLRLPAIRLRGGIRTAYRRLLPLEGFDELKDRLASHGAELIEPSERTAFDRFFFRDPSGYFFEVVENKEGVKPPRRPFVPRRHVAPPSAASPSAPSARLRSSPGGRRAGEGRGAIPRPVAAGGPGIPLHLADLAPVPDPP